MLVSCGILMLGCGPADEPETDPGSGGGGGSAPAGCAPGEVPEGDACRPAGIPPNGCGAGFTHDGVDGCTPVLPASPCLPGEMAIPGESACRAIAACGAGTWGDIPTAATTQYVDAAYTGGASNGSAMAPWTTIQAGVDAAMDGAVVAIAAGSYAESVLLQNRTLTVHGRCPAMVEIVGPNGAPEAVNVAGGAPHIRGVAIRGDGKGINGRYTPDLLLEQIWVHDTSDNGIWLVSVPGARLLGSLVEGTAGAAVYVVGSAVTVEASVLRNTVAPSSGYSEAISSWRQAAARSDVRVLGSLLESAVGVGVGSVSSDLEIESTVIRDTATLPNGTWGIGVFAGAENMDTSLAVIRTSVIQGNHGSGILADAATLELDRTMVRDQLPQTVPQGSFDFGFGVSIQSRTTTGQRASASIQSSVVAGNHGAGITIAGSDITIHASVVRDTKAQVLDATLGRGVNAQAETTQAQRPNVVIDRSVVAGCLEVGVAVLGGDLSVDGSLIRDTSPQASDGLLGRGVVVQDDPVATGGSVATLSSSSIDASFDTGVIVISSDATLDGVSISNTQVRLADGLFGDGVAVMSYQGAASATIGRSRVAGAGRASIASFGAAIALSGTAIECSPILLDGESYQGLSFSFVDGGGNACGCGGEQVACQAVSSSLVAPDPLPAGPTM